MSRRHIRVCERIVNKYTGEPMKDLFDEDFGEFLQFLFAIRTTSNEPGIGSLFDVFSGELRESFLSVLLLQHTSAYVDGSDHKSSHGVVRWVLLIWFSILVSMVDVEVSSVWIRLENSHGLGRIILRRHPGLDGMHE